MALPPTSPPRPRRHRRPLVAAIIVATTIAAALGFTQLVRYLARQPINQALAAAQRNAHGRIGSGLDPVFTQQLAAGTNVLVLDATLEVPTALGAGYDMPYCIEGLEAAFTDALGSGVIDVQLSSRRPSPHLQMSAAIQASDTRYRSRGSDETSTGITLTADMTLAGKHVHAEVTPSDHIEIEVRRYDHDFGSQPLTSAETKRALMKGVCQQAGYRLLAELTTWKPPAFDPATACVRGVNCRKAAQAFEDSDPARAAILYGEACVDDDDDDACVLAALMLESVGTTDHSVVFQLDMACAPRDRPSACLGAGMARLLPVKLGGKPDADERARALSELLVACDRGVADACPLAAALLHGTAFASSARVLTDKHPVKSKQLGTVFALRWGQWTELDRGQPTAWVTRPPPHAPRGAIVTPFAAAHVPAGISVPPGVETVYAVALDGRGGARCERCARDVPHPTRFEMTPSSCVCALVPTR